MSNSTFEVVAEFVGYCATPVELPEGKTVEDIEDWYIKWGSFYYWMDGVLYEEEIFEPEFDMKRPSHSRLDLVEG